MRLNFTPALQIDNIFQSYQINRSAANKAGVNNTADSREARQDSFTLSAAGKTMNLINNLMKQKMEITDRKNSLIASARENGTSMESIKSQIEAYDEQLVNIDVQISDAMKRELEKDEDQKNGDDKPKTREELQEERLNDVVTLSGDIQHMDLIDSVKTKVDQRARILKSEIALDNGRQGAAAYKTQELSDLKRKSAELASDIGSRIVDITEELDENNEKTPAEDPEKSGGADSQTLE